ncbi:hypothetical protein OIO90_005313 [Microbotryomycetes sp. JL221]|nr:hypothetical protein OIO90_005313 [Microbotryomycetes sp. JL221]
MDTTPSHTSHPLRPYAVVPELTSDWTLGSSSGSVSAGPSSARSYGSTSTSSSSSSRPSSFDARAPPARNRYESTSLIGDLDASARDSNGNGGAMLRAFVTSSLLRFSGTALVMPFEVGKTLAQVQWVPKEGLNPLVWDFDEEMREEAVDLEDEAEAESYFADLDNISNKQAFPARDYETAPRPTSPSGYLLRPGVKDDQLGTKPEWVMPIVVQGGVWDMIRAIGRWKGEGWASLWKGQLTTFMLDVVSTAIQPLVLTTLSFAFLPSSPLASLPLIYSPRPMPLLLLSTLSHAITSIAVSPLDLVRTRLIVQSAQPTHRKYSGPVDAIATILREEGGLWTTYFHPNLFIPTLLESVLRPLICISTPLIISRYLFIEPSTSPLSFSLAEFVMGTAGLLVTVPLETIRKRLQIQSRADFVRAGRAGGTGKAWRTCVETRPAPYVGVVECAYRIVTEETGRIPRRTRRPSRGPPTPGVRPEPEGPREDLGPMGLGVGSGLTQLYRGFGMGVGANLCVFLLSLLAGGTETSGWAEL